MYARNRKELNILKRFTDPSVRANIELDLRLLDSLDELINDVELYLSGVACRPAPLFPRGDRAVLLKRHGLVRDDFLGVGRKLYSHRDSPARVSRASSDSVTMRKKLKNQSATEVRPLDFRDHIEVMPRCEASLFGTEKCPADDHRHCDDDETCNHGHEKIEGLH
jgi:hypothetical protein